MEYDLITKDEQDEIIANAIRERQKEHFHYELNKQNYAYILQQLDASDPPLPDDWPPSLSQYRNMGSAQLAGYLKGDDFDLANRLAYRDRVRMLLATETAEQEKCERAYNALSEKLPDKAVRDTALTRVDAKAAQAKVA